MTASRLGIVGGVLLSLSAVCVTAAGSAWALSPSLLTRDPAVLTVPAASVGSRNQDASRSSAPADADPLSRNVAARARMLECGHQWSTMKRAGTASGTWKDFSRVCLTQK